MEDFVGYPPWIGNPHASKMADQVALASSPASSAGGAKFRPIFPGCQLIKSPAGQAIAAGER